MAETNIPASEGSPEQLPRGAATQLNENTNLQAPEPVALSQGPVEATGATETPAGGGDGTQGPEEGSEDLQPAEAADYEPLFEPGSEDEEFITSPTSRPDEAQWVGAQSKRTLPQAVRRHLGPLQEAAAMPGASPELVSLVKYLLRQA